MDLSDDAIHPLIGMALEQAVRVLRNLNLRRMELDLDSDADPLDKHMINVEIEAQELTVQLILNYLEARGVLDEYV